MGFTTLDNVVMYMYMYHNYNCTVTMAPMHGPYDVWGLWKYPLY